MYVTSANLFTSGDFISHAGLPLKWKIECDAIRPEEWDCLAQMIMDYQKEPFGKVVGIPRGGKALEGAMEKYVTPGNDKTMVVDDVYTTGQSFSDFYLNGDVFKWCVFARKTPTNGVRALFTMPDP